MAQIEEETNFSQALELAADSEDNLEMKGENFPILAEAEMQALSVFGNLLSLDLSMNKISRIDASITRACP